MPEYTVKQGDCMSSIADRNGLFWETVWNRPENAELKEKRKDPNVLLPGDVVFIPDKRLQEKSGATGRLHRFRKKGVPARLRLRFLNDNQQPMSGAPYVIIVEGVFSNGRLDAAGMLDVPIPPTASSARATVGEFPNTLSYEVSLGHLDPLETTAGVQARLNDLGFDCEPVDGILGDQTRKALRAFQEQHGLPANGELDQQTRQKLRDAYGR
jgi:hypothetical protein